MAGTFIPVLSVSDHSCSKRETDEVPNWILNAYPVADKYVQ